jgi:hypothetical protein
MEQLIPISNNIIVKPKLSNGNFMFFEKLNSIGNKKNVFLEAEIPDISLKLEWEEYSMPDLKKDEFMPMLSPKLYSYKFPLFAFFTKDNSRLECPNQNDVQHGEVYEVRMNEKVIFQSNTNNSGLVNCSWLIDFFLNVDKISKESHKNEKLIWTKREDTFEIILESEQNDKKVSERQIIAFHNDFESFSWKHFVYLK